jgi:hypothetical protein
MLNAHVRRRRIPFAHSRSAVQRVRIANRRLSLIALSVGFRVLWVAWGRLELLIGSTRSWSGGEFFRTFEDCTFICGSTIPNHSNLYFETEQTLGDFGD